jgi:hypothetical protein
VAKTGYPNFVLKYTAPWRGTQHVWSVASSHSGALLSSNAQVLSLLQSIHGVFAEFMSVAAADQYLSGYRYYDGHASAAIYEADYTSAAASASAGWAAPADYGGAYAGTNNNVCGLETCLVLQAPIGNSSSGRPLFMRKWIHGVPAGNDMDQPPLSTSAAAIVAQLGNGTLPYNRVLVSPKGAQGAWVYNGYYGAHKMPRRNPKRTSSSSLFSLAQDISKLKSLASDFPDP